MVAFVLVFGLALPLLLKVLVSGSPFVFFLLIALIFYLKKLEVAK
jgi:hypothetical protein